MTVNEVGNKVVLNCLTSSDGHISKRCIIKQELIYPHWDLYLNGVT